MKAEVTFNFDWEGEHSIHVDKDTPVTTKQLKILEACAMLIGTAIQYEDFNT